MRTPTATPDAKYVADRLFPLDIDGMAVMADPPENFPSFLVLRLCEPKTINGMTGVGAPRQAIRPPLVSSSAGGFFSLNALGRKVLVELQRSGALPNGEL